MPDPLDLKLNTLRNALYHAGRWRWLESVNRWLNLVVILAGASAFADIAKNTLDAKWLALLATLAGTLQLVFDFSGRARDHQLLQRRYYDLLAQMERVADPALDITLGWCGDLAAICADEPPQMRALDAVAYNAAADALDGPQRVVLPRWHAMLAQVWPFQDHTYRTRPRDEAALSG